MYHDLYIPSPVDGYLESFQVGVVVNRATRDSYASLLVGMFSLLLGRSRMARSKGRCVFNIMSNCQLVFQSGTTFFISTSSLRALVIPYSRPTI